MKNQIGAKSEEKILMASDELILRKNKVQTS